MCDSTQHKGAHDGLHAGADRGIGQLMSRAMLCCGGVGAQDSLALVVTQIEHVWQASSKRLDLVHEDIPAIQVTCTSCVRCQATSAMGCGFSARGSLTTHT